MGQVRTAAELRNSSPKRGWDGVLRVSQLSQTPDTSRANDTRRRDGTPTLAVPAVGVTRSSLNPALADYVRNKLADLE